MIIKDKMTISKYGDNRIPITFYKGEIWMTQIAIAQLYDVQRLTIKKHLKNAYKKGKLVETDVIDHAKETEDSETIGATEYYNLKAIKNIGHRINSGYVVKLEAWLEKRKSK